MPSQPSIAVLVTNYDRWDLIEQCVRQCCIHDRGNFHSLLIYDDGSPSRFAGDLPEGCRIFSGSQNLGLTKALNRAFSMLSEDIVVILDSDAFPVTPFCREVADIFQNDPSLGLVALRTIGKSQGPTESFTTEPNLWSLLLGQALYAKAARWLGDKSGNISVFTCAMAVRKSAFAELGGFDETFDWLDLDHDLSMRMNRSHWKTAICDGPLIFHEGGGTSQQTRARVLRHYKNRWRLLRKFHRVRIPKLARIIILLRLYTEYTVLALVGRYLIADEAVFQDKLQGRRELISYCSNHYL